MTGLLTEALRARIGETATYTAPEQIGLAAGRYFALAVGDANPLYRTPVDGVGPVVPPSWLMETNSYADVPIDADGFAGHSWHLDVPDARLVRGGHSYRWTRDVLPSDVVTATWSLQDMVERTTRTGAAMLVVTSACRYTAADSDPICEQTEDLVFVALAT
ncbi:MAG TPA: MaoC family dehydratase N-terminal domain-containing protein [Mycobacteriales bacterium]|jgi:hypothetical protein|nr:MaoC family dehydratase N-terminal domain-containing protein [Mycobacteriales bacterium]